MREQTWRWPAFISHEGRVPGTRKRRLAAAPMRLRVLDPAVPGDELLVCTWFEELPVVALRELGTCV